jgi:alpha-L-rhamnosidase
VYEPAQRYLEYAKYYRKNGLVCYGLSDWCPPDLPDLKLMDNCLSDSCYYYAMQQIMAKMADFADETEKAQLYRKEAEETKLAIHSRFIQDDCVDNDGQGALAEVLYFRIVEGAQAEKIAAKLARIVEEDRYSYKVGILGLKALLNALSAYGYTDIAYKTVDRDDYPSYGYWKKLGATTLWECWENTSFGSQNHHMYADVINWMFRNIGGLQNAGIAYDKCCLKPYFFDENCSASAKTETPRGIISFDWKKEGCHFTAEIILP